MGVQPGPTSMLPPTRARRGGRGLSLSLFSCLLDCRRPPGEQSRPTSQCGPEHPDPHPICQLAQDIRTPQEDLRSYISNLS